jgi:demethylmenaquinone methyltransferase/2-methoxy-6-polyprenyl-1,4-benzoquinol methylase
MKPDAYKYSAKLYDRIVEPFNRTLREIGLSVYPPKEGMRVLDVGCGTGTTLSLYHNQGCIVSGLDSSPAMLNEAKNKLGNQAKLILGDASRMVYPEKSFDLVISMLTLHEIHPNFRSEIISEMIRILKSEGRILLIDYHPGLINFPKGWNYRLIIYFFEIAAGREHFQNFRNFLKSNGIPSLIAPLNITMERTKIIGGGNLGFYLLRRK